MKLMDVYNRLIDRPLTVKNKEFEEVRGIMCLVKQSNNDNFAASLVEHWFDYDMTVALAWVKEARRLFAVSEAFKAKGRPVGSFKRRVK